MLNAKFNTVSQAGAPAVVAAVDHSGGQGVAAPETHAPASRPRGRPPGSPNHPKVDGKPLPNPTDLPGENSSGGMTTETAQTQKSVSGDGLLDPTALDPTVAAKAEPVTDAVLLDRVTKHNAALIAKGVDTPAQKIKKLISDYAGPAPKTARDIPAEKRAAFLLELEKVA